VLTAQPMTQAVNPGAPVSLSVSAIGAPPLTHQWRKNGIPIPGAVTSTIGVSTAVQGETASYDVVITNPCGTATSQPAGIAVRSAILTMTQPQGAGSVLVTNTNGVAGS